MISLRPFIVAPELPLKLRVNVEALGADVCWGQCAHEERLNNYLALLQQLRAAT